MSDQVDTRFLSDGLIGKTLTNVTEKNCIGTVDLMCELTVRIFSLSGRMIMTSFLKLK